MNKVDDQYSLISLKKVPEVTLLTLILKIKIVDQQVLYLIKTLRGEFFSATSPTEAYAKFRAANEIPSLCETLRYPYSFWGVESSHIQQQLITYATNDPAPTHRDAMETSSFKDCAAICSSTVESADELVLFGEKAIAATVKSMIEAAEVALITGRQPERRVKLIVSKLLDHPDIKKVTKAVIHDRTGWSAKEQNAITGLLSRLRKGVLELKSARSTKGLATYRSILNICAPKSGSGLFRTTARLMGLKSYLGLVAANSRMEVILKEIDNDGG
jgi:hypothetical protein